MEGVLSITIQDLMEIDSGRGINFDICNWSNNGLRIIMRIGWQYYARIVTINETNTRFEFKPFLLDELQQHADKLYEKHLEDERKKREI